MISGHPIFKRFLELMSYQPDPRDLGITGSVVNVMPLRMLRALERNISDLIET